MHLDDARFQVHGLALARDLVRLATPNLDRRVLWGRLLDFPFEGLEHFVELILAHIYRYSLANELPVRIKSVGGPAHTNNGLVALIGSRNEFAKPHGRPDENNENAGSARVEGAGVASAADACA